MSALKVFMRGRTMVVACWDCHLDVRVLDRGGYVTLNHLRILERDHNMRRHPTDYTAIADVVQDVDE